MPYIVDGPGCPPVWVDGIVIECEKDTWEAEVQAAQKAWFDDPHSLEKKATFAMKLRQWAGRPDVRRPVLVTHAENLEKECQDALLRRSAPEGV